MRLHRSCIIMILLAVQSVLRPAVGIAASEEGCTIGVASARVTADGRPLLWKVRDNSDLPNNSVCFDTTFPIRFIAVTNSGDLDVWMGVNERGFAIMNATALDLPGGTEGFTNGALMRYALGTCSSAAEFQRILDSTNEGGRRTQASFGVIDASGAAMIFETGGYEYWRFDANDPTQSRFGCVVRTNFSLVGGGSTGIERYRRALEQIGEFVTGDSLNARTLLRYHARDFSDQNSLPVTVPYPHDWTPTFPLGYVYSNFSVSRHKSVSAVVMTGVTPQEQPTLSTMWTILGQPATGIAVPYWPVGDPPEVARGDSTSALHAAAVKIRSVLFDLPLYPDYVDTYKLRDEVGNGFWSWVFPLEDSITHAAGKLLERWRHGPPSREPVLRAEDAFATSALAKLTDSYARLLQRTAIVVANDIPIADVNGDLLQRGDMVQLVWAGEDGLIDPPNMQLGSPEWGQPSGDDRLIGFVHAIGDNVTTEGTFRFQTVAWSGHRLGYPAEGDLLCVRVFNSDRLLGATRYGDAQLFQVTLDGSNEYVPRIKDGQTSIPLRGLNVASRAGSNLLPNFPNPFNASTAIEFDVSAVRGMQSAVELTIFNSLGQRVKNLFAGSLSGGRHRVDWDGRDNRGQMQPTGTYFVRFKEGPTMRVQRMLLVK